MNNIIDLNDAREVETPSLAEAYRSIFAVREEYASRPAILRREVDRLRFDALQGRAALVADIRRELAILNEHLDAGPVGDGGGLIWRLAMLNAYDDLDITEGAS